MCKIPTKPTRLSSRTLSDDQTPNFDFFEDVYVPEDFDTSVYNWDSLAKVELDAADGPLDIYDMSSTTTPSAGSYSESDQAVTSPEQDLAALSPAIAPVYLDNYSATWLSQQSIATPPVLTQPTSPAAVVPAAIKPELAASVTESKPRAVATATASRTTSAGKRSLTDAKLAKRERNRLAAEKYRKKGRDLIDKLTKKCGDLMHDNDQLRSNLSRLEDEVKYMRDLLKHVTVSKVNGVTTVVPINPQQPSNPQTTQ